MERCKHCGNPIQKCAGQWYHIDGSKRFCTPIKKAEPKETTGKDEVV
jgi:hypothetical protein